LALGFYPVNRLVSQSFIYSPTDALLSCLKNSIKIYIKTAPAFDVNFNVVFNLLAQDFFLIIAHPVYKM